MDNLVNSLVTKTIGLTDQQVVSKLLANPNMNDSQIVQLMQSSGISPSQMSRVANIPEGQIAARVAATIPQGSSATLGDTVIVPQYRTTGSGETQEIGPLEGFATSKSNGDPNYKAPVGTPMQMYSADGQFVSTVKTKKDQSFFGGLVDALKDPVVLAALGGAYAGGLLGGAGTSIGSVGAVGSDLAGLSGIPAGTSALTAAESAALYGGGANTLSSLGVVGSDLAGLSGIPAGTGALTAAESAALYGTGGASTANLAGTAAGSTLANAAGTALGTGAGTALGTTLGTGLVLNAAGNLLGTAANQSGINNARDAITTGSATANTALNKAYTDAQGLNVAGRTDLANNYLNLNTNLNNTINSQVGAYNTANTGIKANATTELDLLKNNLASQTTQANANATGLKSNYDTTLANMGSLYDKQVAIQQPYQNIGNRASTEMLSNTPYFTRQFTNADLNEQLAPNYAFQLAQGQMANQRLGNMGGGAIGGNVAKGLQDYTQNYASGAYQNAFKNFQDQRQNIYSTLAGMANIGTTSGGQLASLGNTYGSNMGGLSSNLGSNLTSNTGNLLNAGNVYGTNTAGVTNNLNNVLSSNLNTLQGAYNQYGSNLTSGSTNYANNLTTNTGAGMNAANVYGLNTANLATGTAAALAGNSIATGANNATALSNLGNTALLGSMIKAT